MSAPVDVLKLLRYHARISTSTWGPDNQDVDALAAFAELIEAVEAERKGDYFDSEVELFSEFRIRRRRQKERVSFALSRVKGE